MSIRTKINILFRTKDEIKRRRCDRNIHKDMRIPVYINKKINHFYS